MKADQINKMTVIGNIQGMQRVIGEVDWGLDSLLKKTYDELHDLQNSLIPAYNAKLKM